MEPTGPDLLVAYVGAHTDEQIEDAQLCWDEAEALVSAYVQDVAEGTIPDVILERAIKEVGAELFHRKQAKNGIVQFAAPDAQPVRVARDPMVAAYPILDRFVRPGLA